MVRQAHHDTQADRRDGPTDATGSWFDKLTMTPRPTAAWFDKLTMTPRPTDATGLWFD
jgi:hypothetical protein